MTHFSSSKRYILLSSTIKALSHPLRLHIVELLGKEQLSVGIIAKKTAAEISVVSRHLSILSHAGMVSSERQGKEIFYSLLIPCLTSLLLCIEQMTHITAEQHATKAKEIIECALPHTHHVTNRITNNQS